MGLYWLKYIKMKKYYIEDNEALPAIQYCETQPEGYTEITDADTLLHLTIKDYLVKEKDGHEFYNTFRSRLLLEIKAGNITPEEAFTVEGYLKDVKDNLITGNWLTAQYVCNALPLSGIFTQALKDEILSGITTYINANY